MISTWFYCTKKKRFSLYSDTPPGFSEPDILRLSYLPPGQKPAAAISNFLVCQATRRALYHMRKLIASTFFRIGDIIFPPFFCFLPVLFYF